MYLASLSPAFSSVSTYFIGSADAIGGGGSPKKPVKPKAKKSCFASADFINDAKRFALKSVAPID